MSTAAFGIFDHFVVMFTDKNKKEM